MVHLQQSIAIGVGLAIAAAMLISVYALGLLRLSAASRPLPIWRSAAFVAGVAIVWAALGSPLASCDAGSLTGHMVQHLLLMTIAPPLVLLGEPVRLLSTGMASSSPRAVVRLFRRAGSLGAAMAFWVGASLTLVLWHVPAVFALALGSPAWHATEQASFLVTGLLFWLPVIEPWPVRPLPPWSIVLYLFMATLPCDVLSGFLVFSDRIAYAAYLSGASEAAVLSDQQRAGALMWTVVTIVYVIAGTVVSSRLLTTVDGRADRSRLAGPTSRSGVRTLRAG